MKKLLYISQYFYPETGAGATRSKAMVKYLSELGWDIEVISELPNYPTGKIHPDYRQKFVQSETIYNSLVHRVWVWANPRRNIFEQLGIFGSFLITSILFALFKLPKKEFDIIYATSPPIFAGLTGALISKISGAKFVLEVRDIWPDAAVDAGKIEKNSFYYRVGKFMERMIYNMADKIIPVTKHSKEIINTRGGEGKATVIYNGVDLEHFYRRKQPQEEIDEPYDPHKFRVGYVGSLGVIHDLQTFVKAAKLLEDDPDYEFVIVGDGGARNKLEQCLEELKPGNITWVGLKSHSKVPAYISSFDIAVNPVYNAKIFESIITVKFYEYLACEVPVISLANGLLKEEGDKSQAVITIEPENAEKLAETITYLKSNKELLEHMQKKASSYIGNTYSRKEQAKRLSNLLNTCK